MADCGGGSAKGLEHEKYLEVAACLEPGKLSRCFLCTDDKPVLTNSVSMSASRTSKVGWQKANEAKAFCQTAFDSVLVA